jgi:hypothetical protein
LTKLLAAADLNPAVKNIAENLKKRATEMKGAK